MKIKTSQILLQSTSFTKKSCKIVTKNNFLSELNLSSTKKKENESKIDDIKSKLQDLMMMTIVNLLLGNNKKTKQQDNKNCHFNSSFKNIDFQISQHNEEKFNPKMVLKTFKMEKTYEYKKTNMINFTTKAKIQTQTGIANINLDINFTQKFYEKHSKKLEQTRMVFQDPLVVQYNIEKSNFDNISKQTFIFDINSDKKNENISLLKDGSGFLALDKNNNNKIDDGSELFGTKTGDGFKELSIFDKDKNGWIDENDDIFNDLKIWCKTEEEDHLLSLKQANIGAIYLNNIQTNFIYDKNINQSMAKLKSASIFLDNNYNAGVISGVDFVKS
jgi:hypothetical protein